MTKFKTREEWLMAAVEKLDKEFFAGNGYDLPKEIRCSVGWAKAAPRAIGQAWPKSASDDDHAEIFVCPTQAEPTQILGIVLHKLIHAWDNNENGHKGPFRKLAKEFGLAGKMTATYVEEESELGATMRRISGELGQWPGAALQKVAAAKKPNPWVRYVSENDDTFKVVVNENKVAEWGPPKDPQGDDMVRVQS